MASTPEIMSVATTEASPLLDSFHQSNTAIMGVKMGRAALAVAAGVATVCGASVIAASISDGLSLQTNQVPLAVPAPVTLTYVLNDQQQQLVDLYCYGPLLDAVQRAGLFNDSKHFVDMPVKSNSSPALIQEEFQIQVQPLLAVSSSADQKKNALDEFVSKHFDEPGSEIQTTVPPDFAETPVPPRIAAIANADYKAWAQALHSLWKELGRSPSRTAVSSYIQPKPLASLGDNSTTTLIVVPGGRFRESYYWDTYWIIEGLLVSGMHTTARRVVQNLLEYVAEFGFVPNGGRIYYLTRSQPPLLSDMVRLVASTTSSTTSDTNSPSWDLEYLRQVVPLLEKEYEFWMATHRVDVTRDGVEYRLNRYTGKANAPRPESYREDVTLAEKVSPGNATSQHELYNDIIAAAASGWDFSSRWFRDEATLACIETRDVVPVDLNVIMYRVETNLAQFYEAIGNSATSAKYANIASARGKAINSVFWHDPSSSWRDFIISKSASSQVVAVSNYSPLWAGRSFIKTIHGTKGGSDRIHRIVQSLLDSGLIQVAGVQTTTKNTGQQWDAPNAWPPLQDILIEGLVNADTAKSRELAKSLIQTWVHTNFQAWQKNKVMFEKFNATAVGDTGNGGEYDPQTGFGWTNGVVLKFLTKYKDFLV